MIVDDLSIRLTATGLLFLSIGCGTPREPNGQAWTLEVAAIRRNAPAKPELWLVLRNNSPGDAPLICVAGWSQTVRGETRATAAPIGACDDSVAFRPVLPGSTLVTRIVSDTDWQELEQGLSAVELVFVETMWLADYGREYIRASWIGSGTTADGFGRRLLNRRPGRELNQTLGWPP